MCYRVGERVGKGGERVCYRVGEKVCKGGLEGVEG